MFVYWSENLHLNFPTDISAGAGRSAAMMNIHTFGALLGWIPGTGSLAASSRAGRKILSSGIRDGEM